MGRCGTICRLKMGNLLGCARRRLDPAVVQARWQALTLRAIDAIVREERERAVDYQRRRWAVLGHTLRRHPWAVLDRLLNRIRSVRWGRITQWRLPAGRPNAAMAAGGPAGVGPVHGPAIAKPRARRRRA